MRAKTLCIPKKWQPFALFNALAFLFFAGAAAYLIFTAIYPSVVFCAFSRISHLYCPGCGGSRAFWLLLRFDILGSLVANPATLTGLVTLGYYEIAFFLSAGRGVRVYSWPAIAYAVLIVVHFVLRNVLLVACGIDPLGDHLAYWSK